MPNSRRDQPNKQNYPALLRLVLTIKTKAKWKQKSKSSY